MTDAHNANGPADIVVTAGRVFSAGFDVPTADSVAVKGGRIAAVGTRSDLRDLVGPGTQVVDVPDGMILPGFQDAHVHPPSSGPELCSATSTTRGRRRVPAAVATTRRPHPDAAWILGGGWSIAAFPGGNAHARTLLEPSCRTAPCTCRTATATAHG